MTQRDAKAVAMRSLVGWLEEKCRAHDGREHGRVRHALLAAWLRAEEAMRPKVAPAPAPAGAGRRYGPSGPRPAQPQPVVRTFRSKAIPGRPRFLSPEQGRILADAVEVACVTHNWLAADSMRRGTELWKVTPKLHAATHLGYDNRGVNPRAVQCYLDEDMTQPAGGASYLRRPFRSSRPIT